MSAEDSIHPCFQHHRKKQKKAATQMHLRHFEEHKLARKTHNSCHEPNIHGRKGKIKTCRRCDIKNQLLDAFNVIESKTRRYSKTLQQNIWKTVSIIVTKSWVQAKNVRKWCHHKNQRIFQQDEKSARQNRVNARALSLWCIADDFIVILAISCSWRLKHRSVEAS